MARLAPKKYIQSLGLFIPYVYFVYSNSLKLLDYLFYIDNLVFPNHILLGVLSYRCLMNHYGLCSTTHNRSYSVVVREPTAYHRIFFLSLDFPYFSLASISFGIFSFFFKYARLAYSFFFSGDTIYLLV